jgi:peptide/nickel transport system substrate-binding protein
VLTQTAALDPQRDYWPDSWELFRCCLVRTLLSYNGRPTREGGAVLRPDLAASMPQVSGDGLMWTFRLKRGVRYAPPLQNVEIKAHDFIRALERQARPKISEEAGYSFYYSIIRGFDDFAAGRGEAIAGLEAPDDHTLRVHLTEPTGDLGERFSVPATAPIPSNPRDPAASLGTAEGHDDGYGRFLVASGPYMFEGAERLDFSLPPSRQRPVAGYAPAKSITLVRNPSWTPSSDRLRAAYADRIEIRIGGTLEQISARLDEGEIDLVMHTGPTAASPAQVRRYQANPALGAVVTEPRDFIRFISMNLALPPFDDIHVRKAVNYAVDKAALLDLWGGPTAGDIIGHIVLNSLENNLLLGYDPYRTPGHRGNVRAARREMAQSRYDENGDGECDVPACRNVLALGLDVLTLPDIARRIEENLRSIGIELDLRLLEPGAVFDMVTDPRAKVGLSLSASLGRDILNPSTYLEGAFSGAFIDVPGGFNHPLLGATAEQLRGWGYRVTSVPSVDDRIRACRERVGSAQLQCWVALDQHLMENVVPWVPYISEIRVQVVPTRVAHFSYDQFGTLPALDHIAIQQEAA